MTEPLQISFRVACPPAHAFEIWASRTSLWWPADHTVSGEDGLEVEIAFVPDGDGATEVRIDHRGWDRLGARGDAWRDRNRRGWETLLPGYVDICEGGGTDGRRDA